MPDPPPHPAENTHAASNSDSNPPSLSVFASLPARRASTITTPLSPSIHNAVRPELPCGRKNPLPAVLEVVEKLTVTGVVALVSANVPGSVQVTPAGAVPAAVHVAVSVPVNEFSAVKVNVTGPFASRGQRQRRRG